MLSPDPGLATSIPGVARSGQAGGIELIAESDAITREGEAEVAQRLRRAFEEVVGISAPAQYPSIDQFRLIKLQLQPRCVLQPEVHVPIDFGPLQPRLHVRCPARIAGD